ncbi:MAG: hypothetical protein H6599_00400 [Flavobacteriales bacterium]|nr:hypothetical protein [Flavobacteriales bacterium]
MKSLLIITLMFCFLDFFGQEDQQVFNYNYDESHYLKEVDSTLFGSSLHRVHLMRDVMVRRANGTYHNGYLVFSFEDSYKQFRSDLYLIPNQKLTGEYLKASPKAFDIWKKGKMRNIIGFSMMGAGAAVVFLEAPLGAKAPTGSFMEQRGLAVFGIAGLSLFTSGFIVKFSGSKLIYEKSILAYNKELYPKHD